MKSTGLLQFRLSWTWLAALLLPVVMCAITTLISGLMPGVHFHYGPEQIISMQDKLDETAIATMKEQLSSVSPALILVQGGNDLTIGATGIAGFITLSIIIAALRAYDKYITKDNIFSSVL